MKNKNKQTKFPVVTSIYCLFPLNELPMESCSLFFSLDARVHLPRLLSLATRPNWVLLLIRLCHYVMEFLIKHLTFYGLGLLNKCRNYPPQARIKKIIQKDEEVGEVAQATPIVICTCLL